VQTAELLRDSDAAIAALEELGDEQALAEVWIVRTWIPWLRCLAAETEEASLRSIEHARRAGDEATEARSTMNLLGAALFGPRPVADALRLATDVAARAEPGTMLAAIAQRAIAGLAAMAGDFARAHEAVERERALLTDLGVPLILAHAAEVHALVELLAGDPAAAEREARRAHELLAGTAEVSAPTLAAILARALEAQGRDDEALKLTEESEQAAGAEDLTTQVQWRGPRARVLARRGERAEAERLAREAVEIAARTDFLSLQGDTLLDLAHVTGERRPAEQALELYERKGNVVGAARARAMGRG
jgi:ATP/maltotriose-dependent transcriptional regulator MalT